MTDDPAFHFPPDVFEAVVNAVPLLVRGKRDVLIFQGCGVSKSYLDTLEPWTFKGSGQSKYHIARAVQRQPRERAYDSIRLCSWTTNSGTLDDHIHYIAYVATSLLRSSGTRRASGHASLGPFMT